MSSGSHTDNPVSYKTDQELSDRIRTVTAGRSESDKRAYAEVKKVIYDINPKKWRTTDSKNWKGTEIKDVLVAKLGPIEVSLEDRKNQGVGFYLQVYDARKEGLSRLGCWLMLHSEDPLYHNIVKVRKTLKPYSGKK